MLFGYVDTFYNLTKNMPSWNRKLNEISHYLKEVKPNLYVLTDGTEFHVSRKGEPFILLHFMPRPNEYDVIASLILDYIKDTKDASTKRIKRGNSMESIFNEMLGSKNISESRVKELLEKQVDESKKAAESISKGDIDSPVFQFDRELLEQIGECEKKL